MSQDLHTRGRARGRATTIHPSMIFAPEGLVLGAGALLLRREGPRHLQSVRGHEARLLALLSAFQGIPTPPSVLRKLECAARAWGEGDVCLAYIHLAQTGLSPPQDLHSGAYRLEMADCAMKCGVQPRAVFEALNLDAEYVDAVEKAYNPSEPRVPAGSGTTSGEWTSNADASVSLGAAFAVPAASLGDLFPAAVDSLGEFAAGVLTRFGGPAVAMFGVLFIPSSNNLSVAGDVSGVRGLSYSWNRDETLLHLNYVDADGKTTNFAAHLDDDAFRDANGNVVARILPGGNIAVDQNIAIPESANDNEPKLCPMPGLDKPGERGRDYEDYIKSIINPVDTTPRYWGFQLINPGSGDRVYYDDCQHDTGMMVEAKGPGYADLLSYPWAMGSITDEWLNQAASQIAAAGTRTVRWYFAEQAAADFAEELFQTRDAGRERIDIKVRSWPAINKNADIMANWSASCDTKIT